MREISSQSHYKKSEFLNRYCMFPMLHIVQKKNLILIPTLQLLPVSWQHRAELNVLAIQLLTSLHLSLHCGRVECTEWSNEDTPLINICKSADENHCDAVLVHLYPFFLSDTASVAALNLSWYIDCKCVKKAVFLHDSSTRSFNSFSPLSYQTDQKYKKLCCGYYVTQLLFSNRTL